MNSQLKSAGGAVVGQALGAILGLALGAGLGAAVGYMLDRIAQQKAAKEPAPSPDATTPPLPKYARTAALGTMGGIIGLIGGGFIGTYKGAAAFAPEGEEREAGTGAVLGSVLGGAVGGITGIPGANIIGAAAGAYAGAGDDEEDEA